MKVKVVNKSNHRLPEYKHPGDAGMDLKANIDSPIVLKPMERQLIPTGLRFQIPEGYEIQIRPRSGLSLKNGIMAILGTIDEPYIGDVGLIIINLGTENFVINPGDRIAQAVLNKVERIEWEEVAELAQTERGEGGFGSTGK